MRPCVFAAFALALAISAIPTLALERAVTRLPLGSADDWTSGTTFPVRYYNTCNDWMWAWTGWSPGDRFGVLGTWAYGPAFTRTRILIDSSSPAGYGCTGTVAVYLADANHCPTGAPLASQPWLPTDAYSWQVHDWPSLWLWYRDWILLYTLGSAVGNPIGVMTDHPAAGPTGPAACGVCYPTTRTVHSFYFGGPASPLCPGSEFNDGTCPAEVVVDFIIVSSAIESQGWGSVKALYR